MNGFTWARLVAAITQSAGPQRAFPQPRFTNRHPHGRPGLVDVLRWTVERSLHGRPKRPTTSLDVVTPDLPRIQGRHSGHFVTWIGHSTVLIQTHGLNILTDPHFSDRASPLSGIGPKRWQAPGLPFHALPNIDLVLISHNHYDHLDLASVTDLAARNNPPLFAIPQGLDRWFAANVPGARTQTMAWDDQMTLGCLDLVFVSVQHWSKRSLGDTDRSLWGGYALLFPGKRLFFAGDLGYSPACAEIGRRHGPFDLAAIPIGAYEPRWFMRNQHIDPTEAVQVHRDVRAKKSLGIHWGTFHGISDEPLDQPPRDLALARAAAGISPDDFFVLRHGETLAVDW